MGTDLPEEVKAELENALRSLEYVNIVAPRHGRPFSDAYLGTVEWRTTEVICKYERMGYDLQEYSRRYNRIIRLGSAKETWDEQQGIRDVSHLSDALADQVRDWVDTRNQTEVEGFFRALPDHECRLVRRWEQWADFGERYVTYLVVTRRVAERGESKIVTIVEMFVEVEI